MPTQRRKETNGQNQEQKRSRYRASSRHCSPICWLACTPPAIAMADMVGIPTCHRFSRDANVMPAPPATTAVVKVSGVKLRELQLARTRRPGCVTDPGKTSACTHYARRQQRARPSRLLRQPGEGLPYIGRACSCSTGSPYPERDGAIPTGFAGSSSASRSPAYGRWCAMCRPARWAGIPGDVPSALRPVGHDTPTTAPTGYQSRPWNLRDLRRAVRQYTSNGWINAAWRGPARPQQHTSRRRIPVAGFANRSTSQAHNRRRPRNRRPQTIDLQALATATIRWRPCSNGQQRRDALVPNYDKVMAIVNQRLAPTVATQQTTQANTTRVTVRSGDTMSARHRHLHRPVTAVPVGVPNWQPQPDLSRSGRHLPAWRRRRRADINARGHPHRDRAPAAAPSAASPPASASATRSSPYRSGNPNVILPRRCCCLLNY